MKSLRLLLLAALSVLGALPLRATIPSAAKTDSRYALGYLVVTYYGTNLNDGVTDATAAIQQAIDDAKANYLAVFFPAGTYIISDTLRCYNYQLWKGSGPDPSPDYRAPALVGSKAGGVRPMIKLKNSSTGFNNTGLVKPMIAYRNFEAADDSATAPALPMDAWSSPTHFNPESWRTWDNLYGYNLRNLDFDCNGANSNAGAVGVSFWGAQWCFIQNVKVTATGAFAGFVGLPAGTGGATNLEVEGGRYGVATGDSIPGVPVEEKKEMVTIAGIRLTNQTGAALRVNNASGPVQAIGFHIKPAAGGKVVEVPTAAGATMRGTFLLMDGTIDMSNNLNAIAIENTPGKTCNVRNVYITGTDSVIKSTTLATITKTGTWKRVVEYTYSDQTPADAVSLTAYHFATRSVDNGVVSGVNVPQPFQTFTPDLTSAPTDLISRHVVADLPSFEDGACANPLSYGAQSVTSDGNYQPYDKPQNYSATYLLNGVSTSTPDNRAAFQAAIDAAHTDGHDRVVVPRGVFHLGGSLQFYPNTKFIGASQVVSVLAVHDSWQPTGPDSPALLVTADDAAAATFVGWITTWARRTGGTGTPSPYDRFTHLLWKAGRNSVTMGIRQRDEFVSHTQGSYARALMKFTGNGGGRHYCFSNFGTTNGGTDFRCLLFDETHEPTWFYTCNVEPSKNGVVAPTANIEIRGSKNIRLVGLKREGQAPTAVLTATTNNTTNNIAFYGHAFTGYANTSAGGVIQISTTSNGIAVVHAGAGWIADTHIMTLLHQDTPLVNTQFPDTISLLKKGTLNDDIMAITVPAPWHGDDIGAVAAIGGESFNSSNNTFTITGSGADVFGAADEFHFVHQPWSGDVTLMVNVTAVQNTNTYAKAGLMIRQGTGANAAHASVAITPGNGAEFLRRVTTGNATTTNTNVTGQTAPKWLKLVRSGGTAFSAFYSADGATWTQIGTSASITLSDPVEIGMFVCSHADGTLNTSAFVNPTVNGSVGSFASEDIGNPTLAGSASLSSGTYTVSGAGNDIYNTSDQFRFLHQSVSGDERIVARVTAVQNTHAFAKAGVMFRDDTTAGGRNVDLVLTPTSGVQFLYRSSIGGATTANTPISGFLAPYWLRLERHSGVFTGWQSPDGTAWYRTGSIGVTMSDPAQVGLAVTSHNASVLNTSTFDNVSVGAAPVWTGTNIGSTGGTSSVDYANDVFTLNGAGSNIYNTADSFFLLHPVDADDRHDHRGSDEHREHQPLRESRADDSAEHGGGLGARHHRAHARLERDRIPATHRERWYDDEHLHGHRHRCAALAETGAQWHRRRELRCLLLVRWRHLDPGRHHRDNLDERHGLHWPGELFVHQHRRSQHQHLRKRLRAVRE